MLNRIQYSYLLYHPGSQMRFVISLKGKGQQVEKADSKMCPFTYRISQDDKRPLLCVPPPHFAMFQRSFLSEHGMTPEGQYDRYGSGF
jgi:hypothetical protein